MLIKYYVFVGYFFWGGGGAKAGKIQGVVTDAQQTKRSIAITEFIEHKMYRFKDLPT